MHGLHARCVIEVLHAENVLARKYFWPGCHNMEPYRSHYPHAGLLLPNTELVANRSFVLPTGAEMHAEVAGTAELLAEDDADGIRMAREVVRKLGWRNAGPTPLRASFAPPS